VLVARFKLVSKRNYILNNVTLCTLNRACASTVVRYAEDKVYASYVREQVIICWKFLAMSDLYVTGRKIIIILVLYYIKLSTSSWSITSCELSQTAGTSYLL
jgi:hypothetical protein